MFRSVRLAPIVAALALCLTSPLPALAQHGSVHESLVFDSELMGAEVRYSVYLPPDYERSARSYPIVYLLHGLGGDETAWIQRGEIDRLLDEAIGRGSVPPTIVVMPDGGRSWYVDSADGTTPWESMFLRELMPHVESAYRVRAVRDYRAIAGLSMGGFGALTLSMRHPDLFAGAVALSAGVVTEGMLLGAERYDEVFALPFGRPGATGQDRLTDHWRAREPSQLVATVDPEPLRSVRYWIDCGDDDFLSTQNGELHAMMLEHEIPHEYRVRDGGHTWKYWRDGIVDGLAYVGRGFRGLR